MTLVSMISRATASGKEGITFIYSDEREEKVSYCDLYRNALRILGGLQARGIRQGDEVVVQMEDNRLFLFAFWGCILGNIVPIPLSCGVQKDQKNKLIRVWKYLTNPYWICEDPQFDRMEGWVTAGEDARLFERIKTRRVSYDDLISCPEEGKIAETDDNGIAYIQFSSGSTSEPKGVCLSHKNLTCNIADIIHSLEIKNQDVLLSWMPLTHDMGMIGFHLMGLYMGIDTICMQTSLFVRRPLLWMEKVSKYRASVLYSPNFGLHYFLAALKNVRTDWDLSRVRSIINGAELISMPLCNAFVNALASYGLRGNAIVTAYGMAEACVEVTAMPVLSEIQSFSLDRDCLNIGDRISIVDADSPAGVKFVDVGYPVPSCTLRITSHNEELLAEDMIGHIQIKGNAIFSEYYNDPGNTVRAFTPDGWLKTGDLGFMHEGRLVVTGRLKNMIIVNGKNYYPQDIEGAITGSGVVELGKVVACGFREGGALVDKLVVFVLHKAGAEDLAILTKQIKEIVFSVIGIQVDEVMAVKKIPKTTSGKIQNYLLIKEYADKKAAERPGEKESGAGPGDIRQSIIDFCADLLANQTIDEHTHLLEHGLNSLSAIQLGSKIHRLTGKDIQIDFVFKHDTVSDILKFLELDMEARSFPDLTKTDDRVYSKLSSAQLRIWRECQANPGSAAYNIPVLLKIDGDLELPALERAMLALILKYEILRTSFEPGDDLPRQLIHAYGDDFFSIQYADLGSSPNSDLESREICWNLSNEALLLDKPCSFRMTVMRLGRNSYRLLFVIHHILIDGWSLDALFTELSAHYNGDRGKDRLARFQFGDYVDWQERLLSYDGMMEDRDYWANELLSLPEPAYLGPVKHKPNPMHPIRITSFEEAFDKDDSELLREVALKLKTTPFCVLMSLVNILCYRYTGKKDITLGFDVAGRITEDLKDVIGYTLNTLCLRNGVDKSDSFEDLAGNVTSKIRLAIKHQLYPFEKMLKDQKANRLLQGNPLFSILVLYQNYPSNRFTFGNCQWVKEFQPIRDGFTDLVLEFREDDGILTLLINYNQDLYTAGGVKLLFRHLINLLRSAARNVFEKIGKLDLLTEEEKQMVLPAVYAAPEVKHIRLPVHILFERRVMAKPDRVALVSGHSVLTYQELNDRANSLALRIKNATNICPDDRIGLAVGRNAGIVIGILAILKAGAAYVALDPTTPTMRLKQIAEDSGMKLLLTDSLLYDVLLGDFEEGFLLSMEDPAIYAIAATNPPFAGTMNNLAYVIYTSGSTGTPKGVMIEHHSLFSYVRQFTQYFDVSDKDVFVQHSSVAFDILVEEIFPALCSSAKIVIAGSDPGDIDALIRLIRDMGVTLLTTTPLVLREINKATEIEKLFLRIVISGGDLLHASDIDKLIGRAEIYNSYGPSEATVCATYKKIGSPEGCSRIGKPIAGRSIYILDEQLQLMPVGMPGEMYIGGGLARGYLGLPEITQERFVANPYGEGILFRTGDIGRWTGEGEIEFIGRLDLQCKIRGHRVELEEVESVIKQYPLIHNAGVIPSAINNFLIAFLAINAGFDEDAFRLYLNERLPAYMIPARFVYPDKMPLTAGNKIDRSVLKQQETAGTARGDERIVPVSDLGKKLLGVAGGILKTDGITILDNFFDLGCDSILANKMVVEIHQTLGYKIGIREIFLYPSVRLLENFLRQTVKRKYEAIVPLTMADNYTLSGFQKGLWLEHQMNKKGYSYNETEIYEIKEGADPAMIRMALEQLVERNEMLRTVFFEIDGEPRQRVSDRSAKPLNFIDVDLSGTESSLESAFAVIEVKQREVFDLKEGPLYRFVLVRMLDRRCFLAVILHHIIIDDLSGKLLIREFAAIYDSIRAGKPTEKGPERLQFRDFVNWDEKQAGNEARIRASEYWLGRLGDELPPLDLPDDRPMRSIKSFESDILYSVLDEASVRKMTTFCREKEVSLFMLLTACTALLVYRYTGATDLIIATPVARRDHPDLLNMIGPLINIVPLRIRIEPGCSPDELLRNIKKWVLEAYEHGGYPYSQIIYDLRAYRGFNQSSLFDVLINLSAQHEQGDLLQLEEPIAGKVKKRVAGNKCGVSLFFENGPGSLSIACEYEKGRFGGERINRMIGHFKNLLEGVIANPSISINTIDYLTGQEKNRIANTFNNTHALLPEVSICGLFTAQVVNNPDNTCITCGGRSYSYAEVNEYADLLSRYLQQHFSLSDGARIGLVLERSENIIFSILAIWRSGLAYVPIDPDAPAERVAFILKNTESPLVLCEPHWLTDKSRLNSPDLPVAICALDWKMMRSQTQESTAVGRQNNPGIAYVIYTSGSSGEPKGVEISHPSVLNVLLSLKKRPGINAGDRMLSVSSYVFDISVAEFFLPLIAGAHLVIAMKEEVMDAKKLMGLMEEYRPALMQTTPGLWILLVGSGWKGSPGLKAITCGEPLYDGLKINLLKLVGQLWNFYGPTETTIFSTGTQITDADELVTIGSPIDNTEAYILDTSGEQVPIGIFGELYIGGAGVARGYVNRPALTAERFVHIKGLPGRVYATGDICRWLEDGTIEYKARNDQQVKIRGFRIEPGEVENAILSFDAVESAAVLYETGEDSDARLVAYIVYKKDRAGTEQELRKTLYAKLPAFMIPALFVSIAEMPLTLSGKVNRKLLSSLKTAAEKDPLKKDYWAPRTRTEQVLLGIWRELIDREEIGMRDNFFEIGGHSLKVNRMINRIYEEFGVEISVPDVFSHLTIEKIGGLIAKSEEHTHYSITI